MSAETRDGWKAHEARCHTAGPMGGEWPSRVRRGFAMRSPSPGPLDSEVTTLEKRLIRVGKYLAKYLRHSPHELGLILQPGGWVPVDDLLAAADTHGFPITYDELVACVETNDRRRFAFDEAGDLIRANQGHSVEVGLQLEGREPPRCSTTARWNASCRRSWRMA